MSYYYLLWDTTEKKKRILKKHLKKETCLLTQEEVLQFVCASVCACNHEGRAFIGSCALRDLLSFFLGCNRTSHAALCDPHATARPGSYDDNQQPHNQAHKTFYLSALATMAVAAVATTTSSPNSSLRLFFSLFFFL